jgi:hypothetical protein
MKLHHRWAVAVLHVFASGVSSLAHAAAVSGQGAWETTLLARDFDGNTATIEGYYDTALNTTWLADANYAGTTMDWATANSWAASLNFNGITGWRLPTVADAYTQGCNFAYSGTNCGYNVDTTTSEMSHMFYATLGNKAFFDTSGVGPQAGSGLTNTGSFYNLQSYTYWSASTWVIGDAWIFGFNDGSQINDYAGNEYYAWAVHSGDVGAAVATVPVPAAVWLFGSGLAGLIGFARRHKAV